jgi:F-type H+-transporting ATPase subunit delta
VTSKSVARRYANALFDVANGNGTLDHLERDLKGLADLLRSHAGLRRVFETQAVTPAKKRAIVDDLIAQIGGLSDEVQRLLVMLAERDRLMLVTELATAFEERLMVQRHIVAADIVTAVPLSAERQAALAQALGKAAGLTVKLTARVDPGIIGGIVATVGGTVYDGSVTRQIERLREKLVNDVS